MQSSFNAKRAEVDPAPAGNGMAPRSALRQQRSRNRQEALLDAAESIISEVGLDGLAMREIGRRSGVPIASLYHYFPSAAAMVRALAARQLARVSELVRDMVDQELGGADLKGFELGAHADAIIVAVATYLETLPAAPAIWNALRSNPELRALNREDTIETARHVATYLRGALPGVPSAKVEAFAAVLLETAGSNLMFALEAPASSKAEHLEALRLFVVSALGAVCDHVGSYPAWRL